MLANVRVQPRFWAYQVTCHRSRKAGRIPSILQLRSVTVRKRLLWGYRKKQMEQLKGFASTKSTVKISDSEVRSSTYSGNFEVVLKNCSKLEGSPKKFDFQV